MEKQAEKKRRIGLPVKIIAYSAVFVALSVVANIFNVYMGFNASNVLSFNYAVCFFGGAFLGPLAGFIIGASGDALGWLINPSGGAFNPFIMVISGLIGAIGGAVFWIYKKAKKGEKITPKADIFLTVLAFILILLICTNLNTVVLYFYYNMSAKYATFGAYYLVRTPKQVLFWAVNLFLCAVLIVPFRKIIKM